MDLPYYKKSDVMLFV